MERLRDAAALLLAAAMLTPPPCTRYIKLDMTVDVSTIFESRLAGMISAEGFTVIVSCGGEESVFELHGGESVRLELPADARELCVSQQISGEFIASYGEPLCSAVWTVAGGQPCAAELHEEYTYQNVSGRVTTADRTYGGVGICSLSEKRVWTTYALPETGNIALRLCNTAATAEYGGLRIDMHGGEKDTDYDVLVRLASNGSLRPAPAGTQYLFRGAGSAEWSLKKIKSTGVVSLKNGESALFARLPADLAWSVRETKNSAKGHTVSYSCNTLDSEGAFAACLTDDGGAQSVSGSIVPDYVASRAPVPAATVTVTIENGE